MQETSLWKLFLLGGPLMWPILFCSVCALAVVIEKIIYFKSITEDTTALKNRIFAEVRKNDIKAALAVCTRSGTPLALVLKAGLLKYGCDKAEIITAMEETACLEIPKIEAKLPVLDAIANLSPWLGFLGTAVGMCSFFHIIQVRVGDMNPVIPLEVAAGVWQALVSTMAGLLVAISTIAAHHYLSARVEDQVLRMERAGKDTVDLLTRVAEMGIIREFSQGDAVPP